MHAAQIGIGWQNVMKFWFGWLEQTNWLVYIVVTWYVLIFTKQIEWHDEIGTRYDRCQLWDSDILHRTIIESHDQDTGTEKYLNVNVFQ